jgi:hypothetical protein
MVKHTYPNKGYMFTLWPYMKQLLCMMVQDRCVIHVVNVIYKVEIGQGYGYKGKAEHEGMRMRVMRVN